MHIWGWILIGISALILAAAVRSIYELGALSVTEYTVKSSKIEEGTSLEVVFISDLHGKTFGADNEKLAEKILALKPAAVLVGGDMGSALESVKDEVAVRLLTRLAQEVPVYYAPGNHEKIVECVDKFKPRWQKLKADFEDAGVKFIYNETIPLGRGVKVTGLDLGFEFVKKVKPRRAEGSDVLAAVGKADESSYNILLAHDPAMAEAYAASGADLILSGHFHGGIVRLFGKGLVSPQFKFFPKYCKGRHVLPKENGKCEIIVTGGLGTHTVNIRLFNKPEIVILKVESDKA